MCGNGHGTAMAHGRISSVTVLCGRVEMPRNHASRLGQCLLHSAFATQPIPHRSYKVLAAAYCIQKLHVAYCIRELHVAGVPPVVSKHVDIPTHLAWKEVAPPIRWNARPDPQFPVGSQHENACIMLVCTHRHAITYTRSYAYAKSTCAAVNDASTTDTHQPIEHTHTSSLCHTHTS